jgi:hypothetical protein
MTEIIVALLAFAGTVVGSLLGILAANKLVNYRIEQLEKKVEKHNNLVERMYNLETKIALDEEEIEHLKGYHQHN